MARLPDTCSMLESLKALDIQWLLVINRAHSAHLDQMMRLLSDKLVWVPLYAALVGFSIWKMGWKSGLTASLFLVAAVGLSDQTASALFKPLFQRLRPCHDPSVMALLHLPDGCGGQYGFASSHASNTICVAIFYIILFSRKFMGFWTLLGWAGMVSYSRIYLGAHYPGDILVGAIIGAFWAWFAWKIFQNLSWNISLSAR